MFGKVINNIMDLLPNSKKEAKLERKEAKSSVDALCMERSCNNYLYFEQRKQTDLFMWCCKSPSGPSIKFQVSQIHLTEELKLTGNCLKHSRPLLSFDSGFD